MLHWLSDFMNLGLHFLNYERSESDESLRLNLNVKGILFKPLFLIFIVHLIPCKFNARCLFRI